MKIIDKFLRIIKKNKLDEMTNEIVVMPDKKEMTFAQVMFMAGQYKEVQKRNRELEAANFNLIKENAELKSRLCPAESLELLDQKVLSESENKVLDLIKNKIVPKKGFYQAFKSSKIKISKSSAYRIISGLKKRRLIELKGENYVYVG